jgi:alginate O-acetyltransferase complex protein AlgI
MLFHTWTFLCFFVVVFGGYLALRGTRLWMPWLLVASYVFYGWWNPYYLILIFSSTLLDFVAVMFMDRAGQGGRRLWLMVSVVNNLGLLAFFKYANFFIDNLNAALSLHLPEAARWMPFGLDYLLPVGISFYTFQSMSYTIDFYRGKIGRERSFVRFATFVAFFPQLVAGPIERSSHLLPQFHQAPKVTARHLSDGASLFLVGLFKKVALSNYLALYVERVYASPGDHGSAALLLATFCFAWQIYFDFSGYTDMARGVARAMGFNLMLNFNHPYLATGLGDFWARWHISLSTWFRDYVYLPLGGNRRGASVTYRNLLIVFLVSGFWHGAAWHFIAWGALHAAGIILTRVLERSPAYRDRCPTWAKRLWVFAFVCFTWVFFRAETIGDAWLILTRIVTGAWGDPACPLLMLALIMVAWAYQWASESPRLQRFFTSGTVRVATASAMILFLIFFATGGGEFVYFQF